MLIKESPVKAEEYTVHYLGKKLETFFRKAGLLRIPFFKEREHRAISEIRTVI